MCSILGIIQKCVKLQPDQIREATFLLKDLTHRGPDAAHVEICSESVILGSNRLRITDSTNPEADMPLFSADQKHAVVFNGEIYNFRTLKSQLKDYVYRTNSDTEVLLAAYRRWGRECVRHLEGMYAFCIYDAREDKVFMASDPPGQKTIYLYEDDQAIVFASELDSLVKNPFRRKSYDVAGMGEFISLRYIFGADTHIKEITKLEPGTWVELSGRDREQGRFHALQLGDQSRNDIAAISRDIRSALTLDCLKTFNLEVPYGLLLSGGIDSTAVLAAGSQHGMDFKTFSIGFPALVGSKSMRNEFEHSRGLAQLYGTDHTEIVLGEENYCEYLDKWADMSGEPLGSQEAPCLVRLFEEAVGRVNVMFTGSGPDELFDGYSYGNRMRGKSLADLPREYFNSFQWAGRVNTAALLPNLDVAGPVCRKYEGILQLYEGQSEDLLQLTQALHFHGRLAAYEFRQMDVISMHHSIEARSPLIGGALTSAAFNFDPALKQLRGDEKGIFKQALRGLVPEAIARRPKQPFPTPPEMWFSQEFEERARILFDADCILINSFGIDKGRLKRAWAMKDALSRNIFSRLYTAERLLRRQEPFMTKRSQA